MSHKVTDVRIHAVDAYFLPVTLRVPLKFGPETVTDVVCLRVKMEVESSEGVKATGWGETPLSVSWVWPSQLTVESRTQAMMDFSLLLADELLTFDRTGHPMELGYDFQKECLLPLLEKVNEGKEEKLHIPYLAGLVALSAFDIALHDAFGVSVGRDIYECYSAEYMNRDLSTYLSDKNDQVSCFEGRYPSDYLLANAPKELEVWHLVGGVDPLDDEELTGNEPQDGYPKTLIEWIEEDQLECLKIKLRGTDPDWDYARICKVGSIALPRKVRWLSADFNCTVKDPAYVNAILDRLLAEEPEIFARLLYVEQPFAYELEDNLLDVASVSARKPLFLDESAHDWEFVKLGRSLGWSGVALKTCKTQTGALLSMCWAKQYSMPLMVQDLTNPMLCMIPHVRLAAHAGTIQGVECNAMQFYPAASVPEAVIHTDLFKRSKGKVRFETLSGAGFGYRVNEIQRNLPESSFSKTRIG